MQTTGPELVGLWINLFADPAEYRYFPYMTALGRSAAVQGEVRKYGNGRFRSYSEEGVSRVWSVTLYGCTPEEKRWLEAHIDQQVVVRDDRGNRIFALYYGTDIAEHAYNKDGSLPLSFREVTDSLEV